MSTRDEILGRVRRTLAEAGGDDVRKAAVGQRLAGRPRGLIPERSRGDAAALRRQLVAFLEGQSATVIEIGARDEIPEALSRYLREANLPQRVRVGTDPTLASLPWSRVPQLERQGGRAEPRDEVGFSQAIAGVSETGTLVLASGADNPVTVTFMPETHVVVLDAGTIVGPYEDAWRIVRERFGDRTMPRTVNLVSGPSRTGDIGGQLVMGAHGPRRLCVILVGQD